MPKSVLRGVKVASPVALNLASLEAVKLVSLIAMDQGSWGVGW